jgi:hypothetical protein
MQWASHEYGLWTCKLNQELRLEELTRIVVIWFEQCVEELGVDSLIQLITLNWVERFNSAEWVGIPIPNIKMK